MEDTNPTTGKVSPVLIVIGIILLLGIGGAAGWYFASTNPAKVDQSKTTQPTAISEEGKEDAKNTTDDTTKPELTGSGIVKWQAPASVTIGTILNPELYENIKAEKIGQFKGGVYDGSDLIRVMADSFTQGMGGETDTLLFVKPSSADGQKPYILLTQDSDPVYTGDDWGEKKPAPWTPRYDVDNKFLIPELEYPDVIKGPNGQELKSVKIGYAKLFDGSQYEFLFKEPTWGSVYVDKVVDGRSATGINGFYMRAPDGTERAYRVEVPFMPERSRKPSISWNDNSYSDAEYVYEPLNGCGSYGYANVIRNEFPQTDLVVTGKAGWRDADVVYEFKNSNHPYLKNIYDKEYYVYGDVPKDSYEVFLKKHPVFFWKDPFGRLIRFTNNEFVPQAECGKPVIYLYPQSATDISVQLFPKGGFSVTEPEYGTGWNVTAYPNGKLVEKSSGKTYPYLFWEGRGGQYQSPEKGFVVAQGNVHNFLVEKLAALGLNTQETGDFIEFWEPRMQGSPYYFVGFYGNRVMDEIAPLNVSPKPDTVIRVLMDYTPLSAPITVQEPKLRTPARNGFTLVEWGGVLR